MGNTGKNMLWNIGLACCACSVEGPKSSDTTYKLLRAWGYTMMFYLGLFSREGIIALALGWPQPMRFATFVQCFGTTFYALNTLGLHKIFVSNSKSKKA